MKSIEIFLFLTLFTHKVFTHKVFTKEELSIYDGYDVILFGIYLLINSF